MKINILLFALLFAKSKCLSQIFCVSNDSVSLKIKTVNLTNGDIKGFALEFCNSSFNEIYTGVTQNKEIICYINRVANTVLILCGGTPPALNDYTPQTINLASISRGDIVKFAGKIYQQYRGDIIIKKAEFIKMRKVFIIDYIVFPKTTLLIKDNYNYSNFLINKRRLFYEFNP